jgi:D-glycero-alpha-D-manno-heptose 1-phosphate guanylyltransferase
MNSSATFCADSSNTRSSASDVTPDEAIILVGGLGTRLRPVVPDLPKPMAPVGGRPFLAFLLDALARHAFRRIVLATGFRGDQIQRVMTDRWQGMDLVYSHEAEPLGTGGAIAQAARLLHGGACFVLNGDTYIELDFSTFHRLAASAGGRLGIAVAHVSDVARYGAVMVEGDRVCGFSEKGRSGSGYINAGAYWMSRRLFAVLPRDRAFSFEADVLVPLAEGERVAAYTATAHFIDIGVPEGYFRAQALLGGSHARP